MVDVELLVGIVAVQYIALTTTTSPLRFWGCCAALFVLLLLYHLDLKRKARHKISFKPRIIYIIQRKQVPFGDTRKCQDQLNCILDTSILWYKGEFVMCCVVPRELARHDRWTIGTHIELRRISITCYTCTTMTLNSDTPWLIQLMLLL